MTEERGTLRRAVFFDRDGTLNRELDGAVARADEVELLDGAVEALTELANAGLALVVISNQSWIARGELDHERLARVHERLRELLGAQGAKLDGCFVCPHHESRGFAPYRRACRCRKPQPGLLFEARDALGLDLERSWLVGDALRDLEAARTAGVHGILIATGKGTREFERARAAGHPPPFVRDLRAASEYVLAALRQGK